MSTNSTKADLRHHFQTLRRSMSANVVAAKSATIAREIIAITDWQNTRQVHCFLPLIGDNEPDMRPFIEAALKHNVSVYTSDPGVETGRHVMSLVDSLLQSKIQQYSLTDGIQFDVVIVPMLAYDPATRHRLGFGGGFYDRLLAGQKHAEKVGVCFSECMTTLPVEIHDQTLDVIISN